MNTISAQPFKTNQDKQGYKKHNHSKIGKETSGEWRTKKNNKAKNKS